MIIRDFNKTDLVWLRPMAEKYGSWDDCQKIAADPDGYGLLTAMVVAPYALVLIFYDKHGAVIEGICDNYGIKQFIRLGHYLVRLADTAEIDLHNHKAHEKLWYKKVLLRWGFDQGPEELGYVRYIIKNAEVA